MNPCLIPPVYFPTTVIFVDDNKDFLANLCLQLDPVLAFKLYDSPSNALMACNDVNSQMPVERLFSRYYDTYGLPLTHHVIDVDLDQVHHELYNESRFEQVSVAVIDYDMPGIDGIEFCRRIKNPAIKKILLTGQADEKTAISAFNQGIIDRFILKQDKNVINSLNQSIHELQYAYFNQTERMLADVLAIGKHDFLRDPQFQNEFNKIRVTLEIVEFYLCNGPDGTDGILMLNAKGESSLLIIQDEDARLCQYNIAFDLNAPKALLKALKSNKMVSYFWKTAGHYAPECKNWKTFLFPATELKGKKRYLYSIMSNPPTLETKTVFSYHAFLDQFDQQCWSYS